MPPDDLEVTGQYALERREITGISPEIGIRNREAKAAVVGLTAKQVSYLVHECSAPFRNQRGNLEGDSSGIYRSEEDEIAPLPQTEKFIPSNIQTLVGRLLVSSNKVMGGMYADAREMRVAYAEAYTNLPVYLRSDPRRIYCHISPEIIMLSSRRKRNLSEESGTELPRMLTEIIVENNGIESDTTDYFVRSVRPPVVVRCYSDFDAYDDLQKKPESQLRPNGSCAVDYDFTNRLNKTELRPRCKRISRVDETLYEVNGNLAYGRWVRDAVVNYDDKTEVLKEEYIMERGNLRINTNPSSKSETSLVTTAQPIGERRSYTQWNYDRKDGNLRLILGINGDSDNMVTETVSTQFGQFSISYERSLNGVHQLTFLSAHPVYGEVIRTLMRAEEPDEVLYQRCHSYFMHSIGILENTWSINENLDKETIDEEASK